MRGYERTCRFLLASSIGLLCALTSARGDDLSLDGADYYSNRISGYRGAAFVLAPAFDDQAVVGIASVERRNNPCWIWIGTRSVEEAGRDGAARRDLCGGESMSREMRAQYSNAKRGERMFVSGVRVCTNGQETRVKGFQLQGLRIVYPEESARDEPIAGSSTFTLRAGSAGPIVRPDRFSNPRKDWTADPETPADFRNNCREWLPWAECPYPGQVATAVVAHFEPGVEPRSLTGIGLRCRTVRVKGKVHGAVPAS